MNKQSVMIIASSVFNGQENLMKWHIRLTLTIFHSVIISLSYLCWQHKWPCSPVGVWIQCHAATFEQWKTAAAGSLRPGKKGTLSSFYSDSLSFCPLNNFSHMVLTPPNLMLSITPMRFEYVTMVSINALESTEPSHARVVTWDK